MILISGATGTVGRHVVRLLTNRGAAVRALSRDPARLPAGVDAMRADLADPAPLSAAMAGVDALFLLTAPPVPSPRHDLTLLDAARTAGVRRIVKLSAIGTGERGPDGTEVGTWHRIAEDAVRATATEWTVLRPSSFASNVLGALGGDRPVPDLTGPARQGVIDPRDVAAVAVEALTAPGHAGRTYTLTGPDLLTFRDQLDLLERVLGRGIPSVDQPVDAARERMRAHGMPLAAVAAVLTGVAWARAGHNAVLTDDVPRVLGRPATTVGTWTRDHFAPAAGSVNTAYPGLGRSGISG